jgi:hypothetical protein
MLLTQGTGVQLFSWFFEAPSGGVPQEAAVVTLQHKMRTAHSAEHSQPTDQRHVYVH